MSTLKLLFVESFPREDVALGLKICSCCDSYEFRITSSLWRRRTSATSCLITARRQGCAGRSVPQSRLGSVRSAASLLVVLGLLPPRRGFSISFPCSAAVSTSTEHSKTNLRRRLGQHILGNPVRLDSTHGVFVLCQVFRCCCHVHVQGPRGIDGQMHASSGQSKTRNDSRRHQRSRTADSPTLVRHTARTCCSQCTALFVCTFCAEARGPSESLGIVASVSLTTVVQAAIPKKELVSRVPQMPGFSQSGGASCATSPRRRHRSNHTLVAADNVFQKQPYITHESPPTNERHKKNAWSVAPVHVSSR